MYDRLDSGSGYDLMDAMAMLQDSPVEEFSEAAATAFAEPPPPVAPEPEAGGGYALYRPGVPAARPPAGGIASAAALRSSTGPVAAPALGGLKLHVHAKYEKTGIDLGTRYVHMPERVMHVIRHVFPKPEEWKAFVLTMIPQFRLDPTGDLKKDFLPAAAQDKVLQIARGLYASNIAFNNRIGWNFRRHTMKCLLNGVKYANTDARRKYEVQFGGPHLRRRGETLDTRKYVLDKKKLGRMAISGTTSGAQGEDAEYRFIWVIAGTDPANYAMYTNIPKFDRFHHSTFTAGKSIIAGGEWRVIDGQVDFLNGCSGHYRPELHRLLAAVRWLNVKGALAAGTKVELFQGKTPVKVPAQYLLNDPEYCANKNLKQFPT